MHGRNSHYSPENVHYSVGDTGLKIIFGSILGIGIVAWIGYMMGTMDASKSATWPSAEGNLTEIGAVGLPMPIIGTFFPVRCPYAKYTYVVDNKTYLGQCNAGPSITIIRALTWHPPQPVIPTEAETKQAIEAYERSLPKSNAMHKTDFMTSFGEHYKAAQALFGTIHYPPVTVRFDKAHPEVSVLDPDVLQADKSELYTSIALITLGAVLLGGTFLHGYMSTPGDDPSLSLESALAAQKRRR